MTTPPVFTLPAPAPPPRRGSVPLAAAAVPVVGAVILWLVTGSLFALCFAALGPMMAVASSLDARRAARRERRRDERERERLIADLRIRVSEAHARERAEAAERHPDLARLATAPAELWRRVPGRTAGVVVGRGEAPSSVRVGGDGAGADELRRFAERLADAPIVVPVEAGIAVMGPEPWAAAVVRALAVQLLCRRPPGELRLAAPAPGWAAGYAPTGDASLRLAPPFGRDDVVVTAVAAGAAPPPACAAVLTLTGPCRGVLDHEGQLRTVNVEALSESQAQAVVGLLARRGRDLALGRTLPDEVWRERLPAAVGTGLAAVVGMGVGGPTELDLVADGPHAVVAGVTGSGKSELLVTWVAAMAAGRGPDAVTFLLVDFKGGTAFRRLASLPHVTGVVTDLDARGTRRAIESLRAEIRRREAELAAAGATDVDHPAARMPRLVVVVDEFAALLQQAPELAAVFTDVAARGRGLGIHLVLGTQRVTGVVREAILANCPLRIGLRVTDAADSRALLDAIDAATETERGIAHVRVPGLPIAAVRVARTADDDIAALSAAAGAAPAPAVWLPPLPARLPLAEAPRVAAGLVLGLADEPERQRQEAVTLGREDTGLAVIGGPVSGRSALLAALATQDPTAIVLPRDPEVAWDRVTAVMEEPPAPGVLLLCDDLDLLLSRYPADYATAVVDRLVELVRGWGVRPVLSCARAVGVHARLIELCSRRAQLRLPTRLDHVGAGFDPATYDAQAPRGRGTIDGLTVQFAEAAGPAAPGGDTVPVWRPQPGLSMAVLPGAAAVRRVEAALSGSGAEVDGPAGEPGGRDRPRVLVGDSDGWQRAWARFTALRADAELVIAAECAADYRLLTGDRSLPPFCETGRGRGWLIAEGRPARRILLPGAQDRRLRAVG
ncbi:FtsK/SpoIIIE domain-containing protein [Microbacterium sp. SORGH_AS_0888]|uniref:FtsK/SpoIIIE domain-containing protein n=1 Tax=Microbacterium sp. SORGH_AS_0888 TaxID=3041791 RepID=UPI00278B1023|nr:FtsK/SpoIIIE domain-containing protein [Microbacterium sp. SORGH_AS_0888]MDQ1128010.1 S-DNA-T family DNA segregation ATPase FtsK/SpoIIIE [Microbacterium sp. SORGH_AS_0888]